jgi:hypothetical protein
VYPTHVNRTPELLDDAAAECAKARALEAIPPPARAISMASVICSSVNASSLVLLDSSLATTLNT